MLTVTDKIASAKVHNWRDEIVAGDVLKYWHDTGSFGATVCYARVLKVCPTMLKVRGERGEIGYKRRSWFSGRISAADAERQEISV
jgi:N-acetylneuraminic acid mutarotase